MIRPYKFSTQVKVRFNETDLQSHVNFAHYLSYFDVGATEYMAAIDYDYETMWAAGVDLLYAEAHCNYKSAAKWPEVLQVHTRIAAISRRSLRYEFEIRADEGNRLVATGHIVAVTANRETLEPCAVPQRLRSAVTAFEGAEFRRPHKA